MKLWVWQLNEDRKSYSATNYRMPQWGRVYGGGCTAVCRKARQDTEGT
jgi:hypothetical protein